MQDKIYSTDVAQEKFILTKGSGKVLIEWIPYSELKSNGSKILHAIVNRKLCSNSLEDLKRTYSNQLNWVRYAFPSSFFFFFFLISFRKSLSSVQSNPIQSNLI